MTTIKADGVFQGGGVKGLAIGGALLEFAENPKLNVSEWVNVAGTSAGAIIAAYVAAGHTAAELAKLLDDAPFPSFADYGFGGQFVGGAVNFARHHGLARGEVFRHWFDDKLHGMVFGDVRSEQVGDVVPEHPYRLRMIAADITNHRLLVLPDDLHFYSLPDRKGAIDPETFKVSDAVRMSLSIPYFFTPVELIHIETGNRSTIVDGGTLSNFPIWLFDTDRGNPTRPTFGLKLIGGKSVGEGLRTFISKIGWPAAMQVDISQTQTGAWDQRFMSKSTRVRTCPVDAGTVGTTDFNLDQAGRDGLLHGGRRAAAAFLETFDLEAYRNTFGRPLAIAAATGAGADAPPPPPLAT